MDESNFGPPAAHTWASEHCGLTKKRKQVEEFQTFCGEALGS